MTAVDDPAAAILRGRVRGAVEVLQGCGADVVEEWGVRLIWAGGHTDGFWRDSREAAEEVAARHRPLPPLKIGGVVRRLRLALPAETVEE